MTHRHAAVAPVLSCCSWARRSSSGHSTFTRTLRATPFGPSCSRWLRSGRSPSLRRASCSSVETEPAPLACSVSAIRSARGAHRGFPRCWSSTWRGALKYDIAVGSGTGRNRRDPSHAPRGPDGQAARAALGTLPRLPSRLEPLHVPVASVGGLDGFDPLGDRHRRPVRDRLQPSAARPRPVPLALAMKGSGRVPRGRPSAFSLSFSPSRLQPSAASRRRPSGRAT